MMGDAILRPGLKTRTRALADAARTAALVLLGCVPLLIIAGTIEGFFSASSAPAWLKIGLGIVSGVLLYAYLLGSRASNRQQVCKKSIRRDEAVRRESGPFGAGYLPETVDPPKGPLTNPQASLALSLTPGSSPAEPYQSQ